MTTTVPPILENESERVAALYQLEILDTEAEADFDDIVALASQICDVPMGVISFIDNDRSWFKSKLGVEFNQVPRDMAFCAANLHEKELLLVENADIDVRGRHTFFAKNPDIKFFAGVPLITKEGFTLGHLSVMDIKPREF
ncbi:MAG: GAF domain-containing protein, partial [Bacteroidetes bacterium]|nr:GAF domain-containing protein [Bacteroidota bacterium]